MITRPTAARSPIDERCGLAHALTQEPVATGPISTKRSALNDRLRRGCPGPRGRQARVTRTTAAIVTLLATIAYPGAVAFPRAIASPPPERLDGRPAPAAPGASAPSTVARLALLPVRGVSWLIFKPIEATTAVVERHKWYPRAYEALTSDDRLVGLRPSLRYDTGLALIVGLRFFDRRTLGPGSLYAVTARGGLGTAHAALDVEPPGASGLGLRLAYDHRNNAVFGGIAGESRRDLEAQGRAVARYSDDSLAAALTWRRRLLGPLGVELAASADRHDYGNGVARRDDEPIFDVYCSDPTVRPCTVDPMLVPGFEEGIRVVRGQIGIGLDTRRHPRFSSGVHGGARWTYVHGVTGDPSEHGSVAGEVAGIVAIGDHALTGRVHGGVVDEIGAAPVPFDELMSASGANGVRGLPIGRLRGHSALVGTAEYRWLLAPWLDGLLSVDRGGAFGPWFAGFGFYQMFTSIAIGVITVDPRAVDYARADPRFGVQIAFTPDDGVRLSVTLTAW